MLHSVLIGRHTQIMKIMMIVSEAKPWDLPTPSYVYCCSSSSDAKAMMSIIVLHILATFGTWNGVKDWLQIFGNLAHNVNYVQVHHVKTLQIFHPTLSSIAINWTISYFSIIIAINEITWHCNCPESNAPLGEMIDVHRNLAVVLLHTLHICHIFSKEKNWNNSIALYFHESSTN